MQRLVLFDIDETMIQSDGAGGRAIRRALSEVFALQQDLPNIVMSGKTDPQICQEMMELLGFESHHIHNNLEETFKRYINYLESEIKSTAGFRLHDGVVSLIEALSVNENAHLGLLTGNIEPGARIKLQPFALNHYFSMGAYGSDSADRMQLPSIAVSRAKEIFGVNFSPRQIIIIGDAVNDIACAKGYGAVSIAVNTGRTSWTELEALQPDYLFTSLSDTKQLLEAIFKAE